MNYGSLSSSMIGVGMKESVRRISHFLWKERFEFESKFKLGYDGKSPDVQTSGDTKAQKIYVRYLKENFPDYGIIAEEDDLVIPCKLDGSDLYFTVDPLCGSKAFERKASHGIATMISLCTNNEVIAAYVGDVMTREVYGFRPKSDKVHRISEFEIAEKLEINPDKGTDAILLRGIPSIYSESLNSRIISKYENNKIIVADGSIGLSMARLWKNEMLVHVLQGGRHDPPWDMNPIMGISKKMGFGVYRLHKDELLEVSYPPLKEKVFRPYELIIAHKSMISFLQK